MINSLVLPSDETHLRSHAGNQTNDCRRNGNQIKWLGPLVDPSAFSGESGPELVMCLGNCREHISYIVKNLVITVLVPCPSLHSQALF